MRISDVVVSVEPELNVAAVVFRVGEHDRRALADFARELADSGCRVGGMVQESVFDEQGRVIDYGIAKAELADVIDEGIAFRTSGCPGKFQDDVSACDRPYGDSPPSDIASYPFQPKKRDIKLIRKQLDIPVAVE